MDAISSLTLAITYQSERSLQLPPFAGSLWRGALGPALRDVLCFSRHIPCKTCLLMDECLYPHFYEDNSAPQKGLPSPPRPFVLHVEWAESPQFHERGSLVGFSLTLFSEKAWQRLTYIVAALHRLGERGLGRERTPLSLQSVDVLAPSGHHSSRIYDGVHLLPAPAPRPWPEEAPLNPESAYEVEVELLTPLILQRHGRHLDAGLPFEELLRAILRRRHELLKTYNGDACDSEERLRREGSEALQLCGAVATVEDKTHWQDCSRHSHRQRQKQSLSGLMGKVRYGCVPPKLVPLLLFGALTHAGGSTAMGMGAYTVLVSTRSAGPPFWASALPHGV